MTQSPLIDLSQADRWIRIALERRNLTSFSFEFRYQRVPPKPGLAVEAQGKHTVGLFRLWETGEVDFEIMRGSEFVIEQSGVQATPSSLEATFDGFLCDLERADSSGNPGTHDKL